MVQLSLSFAHCSEYNRREFELKGDLNMQDHLMPFDLINEKDKVKTIKR